MHDTDTMSSDSVRTASRRVAVAEFGKSLEAALPSTAIIPPELLTAFVSLLVEHSVAWLLRCLPQQGPEGVKASLAASDVFARAAARNSVLRSAEELRIKLSGRDVNRLRETLLNRAAEPRGTAAIEEVAEVLDWMVFPA